MEEINNSVEIVDEQNKETDELILNGSWETKKRSYISAAVLGVMGIGAIYFNAQGLLAVILISIQNIIHHVQSSSNDSADSIKILTSGFKIPILIALVVTQYLFLLLPTLWIVKKWHTTQIKKYLRIRSTKYKEIFLAISITIFTLPVVYFISNLLVRSLNIPEEFREISSNLFTPHSNLQFIFLIFAIAITPAICEEVLFRGYFQRTLERKYGAKSFIIAGILFGLYHMQPLSLIGLSILGLLFSFFYYRSKSILPSSLAHFTNNLIAISLMYINQNALSKLLPTNNIIIILIIILSSLIAIGLIIVFYKETAYKKETI